jgi:hypothetical protein
MAKMAAGTQKASARVPTRRTAAGVEIVTVIAIETVETNAVTVTGNVGTRIGTATEIAKTIAVIAIAEMIARTVIVETRIMIRNGAAETIVRIGEMIVAARVPGVTEIAEIRAQSVVEVVHPAALRKRKVTRLQLSPHWP